MLAFRTSDCLVISYTVYIAVQQKTPKAAWGLALQGFKGQFVRWLFLFLFYVIPYCIYSCTIKTPESRMMTGFIGIFYSICAVRNIISFYTVYIAVQVNPL